jgi:hypothetical protein
MLDPRLPPVGVCPHYLWAEARPDPDLGQLLDRYVAVSAAVERCLAAGWDPQRDWLVELGTLPKGRPT